MDHKIEIKKLYGFGLLESIVAIAVFGVTIVIGLSLIAKSLGIIKENEVSDQAAAFMVASLEFTRSPLKDPGELTVGNYYSILRDSNNEIINIVEEPSGVLLEDNESSCNDGSPFYLDIDGSDSGGVFCNQIRVEYVNPLDATNSDFLIRSRIVYKARDGYKWREIVGFKSRTL